VRANHTSTGNSAQPNQKNLSATAVQARNGRPACLLLPHKFEEYLREVYVASFQPGDSQTGVSRNSVGHGVASEDQFNEKAAVIGLLVTQQLLYCFGRSQDAGKQSVAVCPSGGLQFENSSCFLVGHSMKSDTSKAGLMIICLVGAELAMLEWEISRLRDTQSLGACGSLLTRNEQRI